MFSTFQTFLKEQSSSSSLPAELRNSSKITLRGNDIVLYHFGPPFEALTTGSLSPKHMGKNTYTQNDLKWSRKRVMFYTSLDDAERLVATPKRVLYRVEYPVEYLYPFNWDPNNYIDQAFPDRTPSVTDQLREIANLAEKDGYRGFIMRWDRNMYRVDIWEDVPVSSSNIIQRKN